MRDIDYLRISVTDRCNLRCMYCMPAAGIANKPHMEILTFEEILRLVDIFASLGVKKIRLTGGEPLVRKGLIALAESLKSIRGIEELCMTTNGVLLLYYAESLKAAGIDRINVSLDTLDKEKFKKITRCDSLGNVIEGINKLIALHIPVKLNMVVMKGVNEDEVMDFMDFAFSKRITLRFIEFMKVTPMWDEEHFIPIDKVRNICAKKYKLRHIGSVNGEPASYYHAEGGGRVGFIKTDEDNCGRCNRLRLTATGDLRTCLYESQGFCLRSLLRKGASDWEIREIIKEKMGAKQDIDYKNYNSSNLYMCDIGG